MAVLLLDLKYVTMRFENGSERGILQGDIVLFSHVLLNNVLLNKSRHPFFLIP